MRKILYTTAHALPETDVGYDLGRSTSNNLRFGDVLDDALIAELRQASVGYGTVSGSDLLRAAIADNVGLHADQVLTTNGARPFSVIMLATAALLWFWKDLALFIAYGF